MAGGSGEMRKYKARIADKILEKRLLGKGAVLIEGPKWCGKTTTAEQIAGSILYMADPEKEKQNLTMAEISPGRLLKGKIPRLIDEWQIAPKLWDAVRFEVDHRDELGQFILTGSAVPASYEHIHHTGTGRFSWILMRPMSLMEARNPNLRSKTAIRTSNTRYFVDLSIAAAALGSGPLDLIGDLNTFGLMSIRDLRVYPDALNGKIYQLIQQR